MSCEDIPSLLDLQKVKKHADDFGRLMGTGTGTSTNGVTGQVRPTYNKVINDMNSEFNGMIVDMNSEFNGMIVDMNSEFDAQILNMGFTRIGTFASGATITNPRQTLLWDVADGGDGQEYGWSGSFPKVVPATSTPSSTGGISVGAWISRFDPELRIQVSEALRRSYAEAGYDLKGTFSVGITLNTVTDAIIDESTGIVYSWGGTLPKVVAAGSTPASSGGVNVGAWQPTIDMLLRNYVLSFAVMPETYGAKGDGVWDDSPAWLEMLTESKTRFLPIKCRPGAKYTLNTPVKVTDSYGVFIEGNHATICIGAAAGNPSTSMTGLSLTGFPYSSSIKSVLKVENLTFDGTNSFFNIWQDYTDGKPSHIIVGADSVHMRQISLSNVKFKKIVGYGMRFFGYEQLIADNIDVSEVGGHNGQWGLDSQGDAFYLGWRRGITQATFRNVRGEGITQPPGTGTIGGSYYSSRSRIFLTIEHLGNGLNADPDVLTMVNLENVYARNYQRFIHSEANKGDVIVSGVNVDAMADLMLLYVYSAGNGYANFRNSKFKLYDKTYNGTGGMNWGFGATFTDCDIDIIDARYDSGALAHKGGKPTKYVRCTVDNIKNILTNTGGHIRMFECTLKFLESYSQHYNYASTNYFERCDLINKDSTSIKTIAGPAAWGTDKYVDCTFTNLKPLASLLSEKPSTVKLTSTLTGYDITAFKGFFANIYVDSKLVRLPSSVLGLPAENMLIEHKVGSVAAGTPVSFMDAGIDATLYQNHGDVIYVVILSNVASINPYTAILSQTVYGRGGWVLKYVWDGAAYIWDRTDAVGNQAAASMMLGFDTTARTLNRDVSSSAYSDYYGYFYLRKDQLELLCPSAVSPEKVTTAQLSSVTSTINKYDKKFGKEVYNTSTSKFMRSNGTAATSSWLYLDGTAAIVPA